MDLNQSSLFLLDSNWSIDETLQESREKWTHAFDRSYGFFATKIAESIANEIFSVLKESCQDPYKSQPTKDRTLTRTYNFNILKPENAQKLKEMSKEEGQEAPFKEWFQRFTTIEKKEQVVEEKVNLFESVNSSTITNKIQMSNRIQEPVTHIDGSYFKDRMAIIGKRVCEQLDKIFNQFKEIPGNQRLKFSATWLGEKEMGSIRSSPEVQVELWLEEDKKNKDQTLQLASMKEIQAQQKERRTKEIQGLCLYYGGIAVVLIIVIVMMSNCKRPGNVNDIGKGGM